MQNKALINEQVQIIKKSETLDMEWVHLIQEAKKIGLTIEEVKFFLSRKTTSFRKD